MASCGGDLVPARIGQAVSLTDYVTLQGPANYWVGLTSAAPTRSSATLLRADGRAEARSTRQRLEDLCVPAKLVSIRTKTRSVTLTAEEKARRAERLNATRAGLKRFQKWAPLSLAISFLQSATSRALTSRNIVQRHDDPW